MATRKKKQEEPVIVENIVHSAMDELMGDRFDIYAKDVIQDRAIPEARDGMKPVQRRIIYAMWKTNNTIDHPTKKCAHIVGEVMGKYHPHGDTSIYDALVRMSQPWNVRAPLIDFQGNNGSMDGDGAAAYRYTEARLSALSNELVRDINEDTVDMGLTFDDAEFEPTVLPARFPNLFVNGAKGIAVGMATEIPPHNLGEIISAVIYRIEHPSCPIESLMRFVLGPDFPTGGIILNSPGLADIYLSGRGRIEIQSRYSIETNEEGTTQIIVTEIPYQTIKSDLVHAIDQIRHDKVIDGIDEVRDESDKSGVRIAIDLKQGFSAQAILAFLMNKTDLRKSYNANMVAIVEGRPQTLNLLSYCDTYIAHQKDVIVRRSKYELAKNKARLEIVNGLIKAASIITEIIAVIRASEDKADSKKNLQEKFGFTEPQSEAIVTMQLHKLSHTDIVTLENERLALIADIDRLNDIISNETSLNRVIIDDLRKISKTFGTPRLTSIEDENPELRNVNRGDLIASEDVMVVVTRDGYVKRSSLASYKGSNGHNGALPGLKAGDTIVYCGEAQTTDFMLMFTTKGNYLYVPVHLLKANKWNDEGIHVNISVNLDPDDKIIRAYAVRNFRSDLYVALVSKFGQIKKVRLSAFPVSRFTRPIRAMKLLSTDEVADVTITSGNDNLLLISNSTGGKDENALAVFYNENEISPSGTSSSGIKAASFKGKEVKAILAFNPEEKGKIILVTNRGCMRVFGMGNIELSGRLNKPTIIFKSFKKEIHDLIYAQKTLDAEAPYTLHSTLSDGNYLDLTFEDFLLTPMDRYAKTDVKLPKNATIANVFQMEGRVIDDTIQSFAPPISEEEVVEEEPEVRVESREDDQPVEKFEQISIFDDDDF